MNAKVDAYVRKATKWQAEIKELRAIALGFRLREELKWGKPCYALEDGGNVFLIIPFKDSCALGFAKGALLKDPKGILIRPGQSQATRFMKFTSVREIAKMQSVIRAYIREAIANEKAGLDVEHKKTSDYEIPQELQKKLDKTASFRKAFQALTPGRQRGYIIYFSSAKQSKTRESRIEKCTPLILKGKGLYD